MKTKLHTVSITIWIAQLNNVGIYTIWHMQFCTISRGCGYINTKQMYHVTTEPQFR